MSRVKLASKPPKAAKGSKAKYRCAGGPFSGHDFAQADSTTMVFAVESLDKHWRGRYVPEKPGCLQWQDVPIGSEHSALRTR